MKSALRSSIESKLGSTVSAGNCIQKSARISGENHIFQEKFFLFCALSFGLKFVRMPNDTNNDPKPLQFTLKSTKRDSSAFSFQFGKKSHVQSSPKLFSAPQSTNPFHTSSARTTTIAPLKHLSNGFKIPQKPSIASELTSTNLKRHNSLLTTNNSSNPSVSKSVVDTNLVLNDGQNTEFGSSQVYFSDKCQSGLKSTSLTSTLDVENKDASILESSECLIGTSKRQKRDTKLQNKKAVGLQLAFNNNILAKPLSDSKIRKNTTVPSTLLNDSINLQVSNNNASILSDLTPTPTKISRSKSKIVAYPSPSEAENVRVNSSSLFRLNTPATNMPHPLLNQQVEQFVNLPTGQDCSDVDGSISLQIPDELSANSKEDFQNLIQNVQRLLSTTNNSTKQSADLQSQIKGLTSSLKLRERTIEKWKKAGGELLDNLELQNCAADLFELR
jgi:hypothetical protein